MWEREGLFSGIQNGPLQVRCGVRLSLTNDFSASKPKLMLTFKLKVAGKGKKIGVAKWKLDAFTFVNKTDLVSTVIKKKDGAPKLVVSLIFATLSKAISATSSIIQR